ncbi:ABC transporter substrate-binding protein [Fulvimarina sp. 2208YS6-2-32]|uniref:ABC transporter substrate-binding protein n=1 Tax=Fulvimarina uroteuthidis TaxID=3098149 RepID=A0ABU5I2U3_9HYPH|nr:ABC transporter substrate-binding protein [Fulvimarina sp. 2208YS6-2-32]MDY8109467.1 ABC transporter substrate-binding protein [Fulvimarina sp. 2208YS6-2-32]
MKHLVMGLAFAGALLCAAPGHAQDADGALEPVRVGVLKYGTVNWELDAMVREGLDAANGVDVQIVPFAGEAASNVALQSGAVDMIVSDWLWVSRQRATRADYTFVPYSTSVGSLMVPDDSEIETLGDLEGKTIGVAGGPLDKNWLVIQALAQKDHGIDLASRNEIAYGAPPLLAEKARSGELDGVLNFWHYAARLEADGFRTLISGTDAAIAMGTDRPVASIGWVFRDSFAEAHPDAVEGFLAADLATKDLLATSDDIWVSLRPMMQAETDAAYATLIARYREGIPARSIADEVKDTEKLYALLHEIGGETLVGPSDRLVDGTYYSGLGDGR